MADSPEIAELLDKNRRGLAWLRRNHNAWDPEQPARQGDEDFHRILEDTANMEAVIRSQGYQCCILGEKYHCPEDAVITCDHCAGISSSEPEASEPTEPSSNGDQQLSFLTPPTPH